MSELKTNAGEVLHKKYVFSCQNLLDEICVLISFVSLKYNITFALVKGHFEGLPEMVAVVIFIFFFPFSEGFFL